ncbi:hypothetical protein [Aliiruegeria lutimaris]|uniref:LPS sulfotransferase NodH n=1 Tax=Aliiruegeria lutimaris TaxID=571298 RepID=A0A1G8NMT2_9RHOB|nr:hypothetical protein [Aliiruegeria lutimaris]SDI81447.1 LPS sulfotransferase NodH [Aliiruegeria lutimaris]
MARFDGFVLLAEMRTGSNHLEESLNQFDGLHCLGEVFNPDFVGHHDSQELFGMDRAARDADPLEMMRRVFEQADGIGGFRFFHDHDPAVLDAVLSEPRVAKIHLTRNPLDAYVSLKIANATGQWRLTNERHRKTAKIRFEPAEFEAVLARRRRHEVHIARVLQTTGQASFQLSFEQIGDVEILNGLARYLGLNQQISMVSGRLKRQNPAPLSDKVENFEEMQAALAGMNLDGLVQAGASEPRHGAAVPAFLVSEAAPLLFMPVKGGPTEAVARWLAAFGGVQSGFTRKTLRQWKNRNKDARSFTIVSHPVERAHAVFERYVLDCGPGSFAHIRARLRADHGLPIPDGAADETYTARERRTAFLGYLEVVKKTLSGQTALRSDPAFSSQEALLQGLSEVLPIDMIIRAEQIALGLSQAAQQAGLAEIPDAPSAELDGHAALAEIYDDEVEAAVRSAYNRDFMAFGFRRWDA